VRDCDRDNNDISRIFGCDSENRNRNRDDNRSRCYDCDDDNRSRCCDCDDDNRSRCCDCDDDNRNRRIDYDNDNSSDNCQNHTHELVGSVEIDGRKCELHNHRFATVTEGAIKSGCSHIHNVKFKTDCYDGHYHEFCGKTCEAIPVDENHHIHFIDSVTSENNCHEHKFKATTLIDNPIKSECECNDR